MAPMEVAVASANRALSILEWKPALVSMAFSSSSEKMPVRRPVPMKVPMVSKVSEMLKAKMVISTRGILAASENREGRPALVKMAPKVVGSCWQASVKLMELPREVTCMGMPMMAVATMPMRMAPFTLHTSSTMVSTSPMTNSHSTLVFKVAMAGTPDPKFTKPTFKKPM